MFFKLKTASVQAHHVLISKTVSSDPKNNSYDLATWPVALLSQQHYATFFFYDMSY